MYFKITMGFQKQPKLQNFAQSDHPGGSLIKMRQNFAQLIERKEKMTKGEREQ